MNKLSSLILLETLILTPLAIIVFFGTQVRFYFKTDKYLKKNRISSWKKINSIGKMVTGTINGFKLTAYIFSDEDIDDDFIKKEKYHSRKFIRSASIYVLLNFFIWFLFFLVSLFI